jgi:hypothetical protein
MTTPKLMLQVPSALRLFMKNSKKNWLEIIEMHKESYVENFETYQHCQQGTRR